jgi:hypothetical protein
MGRNRRTISKGNLPCCSDRAAFMTTEIHREPTDERGHGGVCSAGYQEHGAILNISPLRAADQEQDDKASDCHKAGN